MYKYIGMFYKNYSYILWKDFRSNKDLNETSRNSLPVEYSDSGSRETARFYRSKHGLMAQVLPSSRHYEDDVKGHA